MVFINPKIDFAFKKIFGSEQSHDILLSFLNALLYEGQPIIEEVQILDPHLAPRIRGLKDSFLDVKARITGNKTVIIEMQVLNVEGFEKRILYNAAKAYATQLYQGEGYIMLEPVIALTITDFIMFAELEQVISHFVLKERTYLLDYPLRDIELVFAELPKFRKELSELETITDKWLYFLQQARRLTAPPEPLTSVAEIRQAFEIANQANLSPEEEDALEKRELFIQDIRNAMTKATKFGLKQGLEQGLEQGRAEGRKQQALEIAQHLLEIWDDETIAQKVGLEITEVRGLRAAAR